MTTVELQEEFKRILEFGYRRGNENDSIKMADFIRELSEQLRIEFNKDEIEGLNPDYKIELEK